MKEIEEVGLERKVKEGVRKRDCEREGGIKNEEETDGKENVEGKIRKGGKRKIQAYKAIRNVLVRLVLFQKMVPRK